MTGGVWRFERTKLVWRRVFAELLAAVCLLNGFFLWYLNHDQPLEAYKTYGQELSAVQPEDRGDFIAKYYRQTHGAQLTEEVMLFRSWQTVEGDVMADQLEQSDSELFSEGLELWNTTGGIRYADSLIDEWSLAQEVYAESLSVVGYDSYLDDIEQRSQTLSGISIFSSNQNDGFSAANIAKTTADYSSMRGTRPVCDISKGVESATAFSVTDLLAVLATALIASLLVFDERRRGLLALVASTPRGRLSTACAKMAALPLGCALTALPLYSMNIGFFAASVGLGDLSRPIQSVGVFCGCTLKLTVGQSLLLFVCGKWLAMVVVGLVITLISTLVRRGAALWLSSAAIFGGCWALYALLPDNSSITWLKYLNPVGLLDTASLYFNYLNLDILGAAVGLSGVAMLLSAVLICLLSAAAAAVLSQRPAGLTASRLALRPIGRCGGHCLLAHEGYKLLVLDRTAAVLAVLLVLTVSELLSTDVYLPPEENGYRQSMMTLDGRTAAEVADELIAKREWYDQLNEQLAQIKEQMRSGELSRDEGSEQSSRIDRLLSGQASFDRVWSRYEYLVNSGGRFVYDTGYIFLLEPGAQSSLGRYLLLCAALILCCSGLCSIDSETRPLLRSTPLGRGRLARKKLAWAAIIASFSFVIVELPRCVTAVTGYGLPGLLTPASSLTSFASSSISLLGLLLGRLAGGLLCSLALCAAVVGISRLCRKRSLALVLSAAVLGLPAALCWLGIVPMPDIIMI